MHEKVVYMTSFNKRVFTYVAAMDKMVTYTIGINKQVNITGIIKR